MCENNDQKFEQYETLCVNADKERKTQQEKHSNNYMLM
jgi:hypothetical protein